MSNYEAPSSCDGEPEAEGPHRALTLGVLAAAYILVVVINFPGHLSYDSILQLTDGRAGRYHTWHPPLMAWLLGLCDHLWRGAALYVGLQTLILFAAFAALVRAAARVRAAGPVWAALLCLSPLTLVWQGIVWKDVLFADLAIAGFVSLLIAFQPTADRRRRVGLSILAFGLLGAAALVRQNGVVVALAGVMALAHGVFGQGGGSWRRRAARAGGAGALALVGTLAFMAGVSQLLLLSAVDRDGPEAQIHMLQTYDVVGAVAHDPKLELSELSPPIAALIRSAAHDRYRPATNMALLGNPFDKTTAKAAGEIEDQWRQIVLHHPLPWLQHRAEVFWWMVMTPSFALCPPELTGVDGPKLQVKRLGLTIHQNARDLALESYADAFHRTPLYSHAAYGAAALALMVMMFRSPRRRDAILGFLLIGMCLFVASFAVIGVACDYRYLYALDLSVMAVGFYAALGWRRPAWLKAPGGRRVQAPSRA